LATAETETKQVPVDQDLALRRQSGCRRGRDCSLWPLWP